MSVNHNVALEISKVENKNIYNAKQINYDWFYIVKKAINYRVFSNPLAMSDIIDIFIEELENQIGKNRYSFLQFLDAERTINIKIDNVKEEFTNASSPELSKVISAFVETFIRLYAMYKTVIDLAIMEASEGNKQYSLMLEDAIKSKNTLIIPQFATFSGYLLRDETGVSCHFISIRLY